MAHLAWAWHSLVAHIYFCGRCGTIERVRVRLDIEDDVLQAAKALARRKGHTIGQVLSTLAREGLASAMIRKPSVRGGVPLLPSRGEIITLESIQKLMDGESL